MKQQSPQDIRQLRKDKRNARKHSDENIETIRRSLKEVGAARSIVIDEDDNILAGNGTAQAAELSGITKLKVVEADGDTVVAVRRTGLTPQQKLRLAILDNRSAELAEWDPDVLKGISQDIDLSDLFEKEELGILTEQPKEQSESLVPYRRVHFLISVDVSNALQIESAIEQLKQIPGVEIEQGAN